jgi:hypothetical protein
LRRDIHSATIGAAGRDKRRPDEGEESVHGVPLFFMVVESMSTTDLDDNPHPAASVVKRR